MNRPEYSAALIEALRISAAIGRLPATEMLDAISHAEAFGPIIDPTLYREKAKDLAYDKGIVAIIAEAKAKLHAHALKGAGYATDGSEVRRPYSVEQADERAAGGAR